MDRLRWMALGAFAALAAAAVQCGYPDNYIFTNTGGAGGAGPGASSSSSTGQSSSSTGTSSSTTSSSTSGSNATSSSASGSSTSGGTCMVQHPGGGTCEYLPGLECGCSGSMKCSVVDEASGASACVSAGTTMSYNQCGVDTDCAAGLWCNHTTQACEPICQSTSDCTAEGGLCEPALQPDGKTPIPGLDVCAAHCDLVTAMPCGPGLTCIYQGTPKEFECTVSAGGAKHDPCNVDADCAPKLGCVDTGLGPECVSWCSPATSAGASGSAGCTSSQFCYSLTPAVSKGSTTYGICQ